MNLVALRFSLNRIWLPRLSSRRKKLAQARREGHASGSLTPTEVKRINNWKGEVAEAEKMVARRRREIAAKTPKPASGRAKAVANARGYVGVAEQPPGSNRSATIDKWQRRFGFRGVAWCGIFCGNMLMDAGVRGVTGRIAAVALIEDDAKAGRGPFVRWTTNERDAESGDLAVIGSYGQHVELVESVNADGSLNTIGGNVGQAVRRMRRSPGQVRGIAKVRF